MKRYIKKYWTHYAIFTRCFSEKCLEFVIKRYESEGNFKINLEPIFGLPDNNVTFCADNAYPFLSNIILAQKNDDFNTLVINCLGKDAHLMNFVLDDIITVCSLKEIGINSEQAQYIDFLIDLTEKSVDHEIDKINKILGSAVIRPRCG